MASRSELNRLFLAICDLAIEWRDSADWTKAQCGEELLDLIDGDHPEATADASNSSRTTTNMKYPKPREPGHSPEMGDRRACARLVKGAAPLSRSG